MLPRGVFFVPQFRVRLVRQLGPELVPPTQQPRLPRQPRQRRHLRGRQREAVGARGRREVGLEVLLGGGLGDDGSAALGAYRGGKGMGGGRTCDSMQA